MKPLGVKGQATYHYLWSLSFIPELGEECSERERDVRTTLEAFVDVS